jgi:hypothetical protein
VASARLDKKKGVEFWIQVAFSMVFVAQASQSSSSTSAAAATTSSPLAG